LKRRVTAHPGAWADDQIMKVNSMDETKIDRDAIGRLAKALAFICGPQHPTTVALRTAAESGAERDIKAARAQFLRLKPGERKAAFSMLQD
jgi:hypothetical protein